MTRITARGGPWPQPVVLRSGWWRAHARPWNEDLPEAGLRPERSSAGFLSACADWLLEQGVEAVRSIPVGRGSVGLWERAGFTVADQLLLLEHPLDRTPEPEVPVRVGGGDDWEAAASIDRAAFSPRWRLGRLGLADAASATPRSVLLVVDDDAGPVGFAVVGVGLSVGYLQRLAVRPAAQGQGAGRSLVRAALRWARAKGARSMLLNTQTDNDGATALYQSEGFQLLPDMLTVFRRTR